MFPLPEAYAELQERLEKAKKSASKSARNKQTPRPASPQAVQDEQQSGCGCSASGRVDFGLESFLRLVRF